MDIQRKATYKCMCVLPKFVSMYHMCTVPAEVKRGIGFPETRVKTMVMNCHVSAKN